MYKGRHFESKDHATPWSGGIFIFLWQFYKEHLQLICRQVLVRSSVIASGTSFVSKAALLLGLNEELSPRAPAAAGSKVSPTMSLGKMLYNKCKKSFFNKGLFRCDKACGCIVLKVQFRGCSCCTVGQELVIKKNFKKRLEWSGHYVKEKAWNKF